MPQRSMCYNKLWKLLIDRKMSHVEFRKTLRLSTNVLTKLKRDEDVALTILKRICDYLDCNIGDICDYKVTDAGDAE